MASRNEKLLTEGLRYIYRDIANQYNDKYPNDPQPFLTATVRFGEEQDALYNAPYDGLDNDGDGQTDERNEKVTNAKAGQSPHNFNPSFAFDIGFQKGGKAYWQLIYFKKFSSLLKAKYGALVTWGGDFRTIPDAPHIEQKNWKQEARRREALGMPPTLYLAQPYLKNDYVKFVQNTVGVKDDGFFGPYTDMRVREWQRQHGLKPDGIVGEKTYRAMAIFVNPKI